MISKYNFHKTKYVEDLLIDVVRLQNIKKREQENPAQDIPFHYIILILSGKGFFCMNDQTYVVEPGNVIFSKPGEIREWDNEGIKDGYALIFREDFLLPFFNDPQFLQSLSFFVPERNTPLLNLAEKDHNRILDLILNIKEEINTFLTKDKHILRPLLYETLTLLNRIYSIENPKEEMSKYLRNKYIKDFASLLNQHFKYNRTVPFYAKKLDITPNNLNEIVKSTKGISAKHFILNKVILETKKLLTHSNMPISEIALALDYDSPSYFVRFFHSQVGVTPLTYRKEYRRMKQQQWRDS